MSSIPFVAIFPRRCMLFAALSILLLSGLAVPPRNASACGCFAPPDVAQPLVQAGEEIVFAVENGQIVMHVKIRYSGRAGDFGWLLPLPSVPMNSLGMPGIDVGVDELFSQLETRTQPTYLLQRFPCIPSRSGPSIGCGAADEASFDPRGAVNMSAEMTPLVKQSTVGPYDYAILKADDKTAMLSWLSNNRYVVPTGTDTAINAYIRPGAYILALRLTAGAQTGDLQPVVLKYPADLPMVPIILTSVGATPNMGVLIWVLGTARAIPRNYAHTVINDVQLDWLNKVQNYNDVITRAVSEAPGKHSFVTEYAGPSGIMGGILDSPGRFTILNSLIAERDPVVFVQSILPKQLSDSDGGRFGLSYLHVSEGFALNGQFFAVVGAHIPMPQQLIAEGITPGDYYQRIAFFLREDRVKRPTAYTDIETRLAAFDPAMLAADLKKRIVDPTLQAGQLFKSVNLRQMTRLYTTLSPEDMNADPVFSFNSSLSDVSHIHQATLSISCKDGSGYLRTDSGFNQSFSEAEVNANAYKSADVPWSQRIETLLDTGMPNVLVDNTMHIWKSLPMGEEPTSSGCTTSKSHRSSGSAYLALCGLIVTGLLLRRRRATFR